MSLTLLFGPCFEGRGHSQERRDWWAWPGEEALPPPGDSLRDNGELDPEVLPLFNWPSTERRFGAAALLWDPLWLALLLRTADPVSRRGVAASWEDDREAEVLRIEAPTLDARSGFDFAGVAVGTSGATSSLIVSWSTTSRGFFWMAVRTVVAVIDEPRLELLPLLALLLMLIRSASGWCSDGVDETREGRSGLIESESGLFRLELRFSVSRARNALHASLTWRRRRLR